VVATDAATDGARGEGRAIHGSPSSDRLAPVCRTAIRCLRMRGGRSLEAATAAAAAAAEASLRLLADDCVDDAVCAIQDAVATPDARKQRTASSFDETEV